MKCIIDFEGERDFMKVIFKQWLSWCRGKKTNQTKQNTALEICNLKDN